jgi:Lon protease-like protein
MFPLGTVLFPGGVVPLHVFEPRYRALTGYCLERDERLGIVLIERGSEVGGGDVRFRVGTRGVIARAQALPDGRWLVVVVGE